MLAMAVARGAGNMLAPFRAVHAGNLRDSGNYLPGSS
jgi:hypothetical protein